MRHISLLAAVFLAGLPTSQALAHDLPPPTVVYPGHWGGPFGLWYGGWQPEMVVNVPNGAPPAAQWQGGYDREGWLRECRQRLGLNSAPAKGAAPAPSPDRCEALLAAPASGAAGPVMLVPVVMVPAPGSNPGQAGAAGRPCKETIVTEEYDEPVLRRSRSIPRHRAPAKRVRLAPDKRISQ